MVTKPPKKGFPNRPGQAGQPVFKGGFSSTVPLPGSVMGAAMPAGPDANKSALTDAVRSGAVDMEAGNLSRALQKAQGVLRIEPSHGDALHQVVGRVVTQDLHRGTRRLGLRVMVASVCMH